MSWDFCTTFSRPITLQLCSRLLYLSIKEVFKWLMHLFKLVDGETISMIYTQDLSLRLFRGGILIGDEKGFSEGQHRQLYYTSAHDLRPLEITLYYLSEP